jgi:ABC-2 type transport system ATP-binding protein
MIHVEKATKWYGPTLAADSVSFDVKEGEIVGFLGPNGAGKSTVLKMISTWLPPTSGSIQVGGRDVVRDPLGVRRILGYLPEHNALYDGMRVDRFLRFIGRAHGLRGARLAERMGWVIDSCSLTAVLSKRIHQCSKGYRQRIGVAAALIHDPPVIVLDEPTHGLDPIQVVAFRDFVIGLRKGRAILFSSHILSEVLAISERILIINGGKLLANSSVMELETRAQNSGSNVESTVLQIVKSSGTGR